MSATLPDPDTTRAPAARAAAEGLLLLPCGHRGNTIRIALPLTTPAPLPDKGLTRPNRALVALHATT